MAYVECREFVDAIDQVLNLRRHPQQELIADVGMGVQQFAEYLARHARHRYVGESKNAYLARLAVNDADRAEEIARLIIPEDHFAVGGLWQLKPQHTALNEEDVGVDLVQFDEPLVATITTLNAALGHTFEFAVMERTKDRKDRKPVGPTPRCSGRNLQHFSRYQFSLPTS